MKFALYNRDSWFRTADGGFDHHEVIDTLDRDWKEGDKVTFAQMEKVSQELIGNRLVDAKCNSIYVDDHPEEPLMLWPPGGNFVDNFDYEVIRKSDIDSRLGS